MRNFGLFLCSSIACGSFADARDRKKFETATGAEGRAIGMKSRIQSPTHGKSPRPIRPARAFASKRSIRASIAAAIRLNASPAKRSTSGPIFFAKATTSSPPPCCGGRRADGEWRREPMQLHNNDRWHGRFTPPEPGLLSVRDRGLDRPIRDLAQGIPPQAGGRPGRVAGGARGPSSC